MADVRQPLKFLLRLSRKPTCASLLTLFAGACLYPASVTLKRGPHQVDVVIGDKPFTTYTFDDAIAKPFLMPLRTASGLVISRSFPVRNTVTPADVKTRSFEPHQRPLYFSHGTIDGLNFWAEKVFDPYYHGESREAYGRMSLNKLEKSSVEGDTGTVSARFNLLAPSGRIIATEMQTLQFRGDDHLRMIDCEFTVYADHGPVTFGDTKEGTFAVRLGPELSAPNDHMLNSKGAQGEAAIWGKTADWVAYSGKVSGKPVSVAVFDSPQSFHHPTTWHARAYGLLAANPFGLREFTKDPAKDGSWTIPEGKSLLFKYRVLISDGVLTGSQLAELYHQYAGRP